MAEKGLGRGFGAIFGEDAVNAGIEGVQLVAISRVEPRAGQPRAVFDEQALDELAESLRIHGMLQPITVRRLDSGYYQIIAGERRWRAARMAGFTEVPVRILEADDRRATELALVENLQREDLNPIEEARGYRSLIDEYGITQEEASHRVGKSRPSVANSLRLLSLCDEVLKQVEDGALSAGHARAILTLPEELQIAASRKIIAERLSVRQTEALAARLTAEAARAKIEDEKEPDRDDRVDYTREVERELSTLLGRGVRLSANRKNGKLELEFYGAEDREALISALRRLGGTFL